MLRFPFDDSYPEDNDAWQARLKLASCRLQGESWTYAASVWGEELAEWLERSYLEHTVEGRKAYLASLDGDGMVSVKAKTDSDSDVPMFLFLFKCLWTEVHLFGTRD